MLKHINIQTESITTGKEQYTHITLLLIAHAIALLSITGRCRLGLRQY